MAFWKKGFPNHLITGLLVVIILFCCSKMIAASTLVDPSRFIFMVKPGTRTTGTIKVTNPGIKPALVNAVVYDWTLNDADKMVTSELGTRPDSLKGLIKFNPRNFKLFPGESQIVRFTLSAPANGPAIERRGIVFFEEKVASNPQQLGANVITQVGSTVYLGIEGMKMEFNLKKVTIRRDGNNYWGQMEIANRGAGHIRYRIGYKIINTGGKVINGTQLPEAVILPDFNREVRFLLPDQLEPGQYNLLLTLHFLGTNQTANRTVPFTVVAK